MSTKTSISGSSSFGLDARKKSLAVACTGNLLEWFDWSLYGIFSVYLAKSFFDPSDPTSGLLATLAIFAVAFIARPVGGIIFGRMADRVGRKNLMVLTMSLLALSSVALAILPTYESVGVLASALLLLVRIVQGLAHGGEVGVTYTYVAEIAPAARRGLWSSWVVMGNTGGLMLATGTAAVLTALLGPEAMNSYGWRIGFALGGILGIAALYLRRTCLESDVFVSEVKHKTSSPLAVEGPKGQINHVVVASQIILVSIGSWITYYAWASFAPAVAISQQGMNPNNAFIATLAAQAVVLVAVPFIGALSDRIGRKPLIIAQGLLMVALVFPIANMVSSNPWTLFFAVLLGLGVWAVQASFFVAVAAELAPTRVRAATLGFVVSLGVAIFGGTGPYLNAWLASKNQSWIFNVYIMVLGVLVVIGGLWVRETSNRDLGDRDWDHEQTPESRSEIVAVKGLG